MSTTFLYSPPQPERTVMVSRGVGPNKRLDDTVDHLAHGFLPVNPKILEDIRAKFQSGDLGTDRATLLETLKMDPALFLYYLKNLPQLTNSAVPPDDPFEALKVIEQEKLEHLFSVRPGDISFHKLDKITKPQALRLQHTMVSSAAAQELATQVELPLGVAFGAAMLRQLTLSLLAWNYPAIYSRALSTCRAKESNLEAELEKQLGVSVQQLAQRFSVLWTVGPELRRAVGSASSDVMPRALQSVRDICTVSELFAKSKDPAHYPKAQALWEKTTQELTTPLSPEFDDSVKRMVRISAQHYADASEQIFSAPLFEEFHEVPATVVVDSLVAKKNPYVARCPEELRTFFRAIYEGCKFAEVNVDGIRVLVDHLIPAAGFSRGCLYLLDGDSRNIRPALRIGDVPLAHYPTTWPDDGSKVAAFIRSSVPSTWEGQGLSGRYGEVIVAGLNGDKLSGVLYLELTPPEGEKRELKHILHFNAIRRAFLDCLGEI